MKPEQQQLIDDVLADVTRREATLFAGAKILRRRRQALAVRRILTLAMVGVAVVLVLEQTYRKISPGSVAATKAAVPASPKVKFITDAELLALFPNTPVGLAKLSNGKKILIFPRPGDEARLVIRL